MNKQINVLPYLLMDMEFLMILTAIIQLLNL